MTLNSDELARLLETSDLERIIPTSVFCGRCGYNLRYQPFVGRCPECGNGYNARPLVMKGVMKLDELRFPAGDTLLSLLSIALGLAIILMAVATRKGPGAFGGGLFMLMGLLLGQHALRKARRFFRLLKLIRQAQEQDDW